MEPNNEEEVIVKEIPKYITIDDNIYSLKAELANDRFSYKCYHRK